MFHAGSSFPFSEKSETALCVQLRRMCLFSSRPLLFHWRPFSFVPLNPPRLSKVALQPFPSLNPSEVPTLHLKRRCEEGEFGGGGWGVRWGRGVVLL